MRNKKQKESRWLLVWAVISFALAITLNIEDTPHTITIENNRPDMFHVEQVEAKEEKSKALTLEDKIKQTFFEQPSIALAVAKIESGLNPSQESNTDRMADGRPFSIGLMQINITVHKLGDKECNKAFEGRNYKAKVVNEELYNECVKLAMNEDENLKTARGIYERSGKHFGQWGAYTNGSYMKYMNN